MKTALTVALIFCAGLGAAAQFGKISILFAALSAHYAGASPVAMGWMVSIVGLVGLIFGAMAGLMIGPAGPGRVMVAALVAAAVASLAQAALPAYPAMMALRVVEGVTHLAIVVAGPVLMAAQATARSRGFVMALWGSFFGLAYAILAETLPPLTAARGLGSAFVAHGLWMAGCAAALWLLLPRDGAVAAPAAGNVLARHVAIYRSPRVAAPALGFVCYTILFVALLTLLPPLVPEATRGLVALGMPLISIAVSLTLGVWLLRHLTAVQTVQVGFACAAMAVLALWAGWGMAWPMAVAALGIAAAFGLVQGASFAAIAELNASDGDRAMAAGAVAQMGNLGTVTGTPLLAFLLTQGADATAILAFGLPFCLAGIAVHMVNARRRAA
jgi:MFS family permease